MKYENKSEFEWATTSERLTNDLIKIILTGLDKKKLKAFNIKTEEWQNGVRANKKLSERDKSHFFTIFNALWVISGRLLNEIQEVEKMLKKREKSKSKKEILKYIG